MNNNEPFKKRVEIVFGESDRDIWEWLEGKKRKATFIKKMLREQKIKEEVERKINKEEEEVERKINNTTYKYKKRTNGFIGIGKEF
ncbi:hypothetical protein NSQ61_19870 [Aeribacillus sp. FSL K6-1121]|uniref:hypothetical protein n=1 Tax=Aeribacillus sp. FSL K6-1121 TaxID=2954745 RepID=UPI0030FA16D1